MATVLDAMVDTADDGRFADFWARHPLLILAIGTATGIAIDAAAVDLLSIPFLSRLATWIVISLCGALLFGFTRNRVRLAAIVVLFSALGGLCHAHRGFRYDTSPVLSIADVDGEPAIIDGTITQPVVIRRNPLGDLPSRRDQSPWQSMIRIDMTAIRNGHTFEPCRGHLMVVSNGLLEQFRPGDKIRVHGQLQQINAPTNPGEIDFRKVYRHRGVHARVDVDSEDQIILQSQTFRYGRPIAALSTRSREILLRHVGETMGPLAVALVIGQREFVDSETRDSLLVTGTAHLLSVSGLHLAIVIVLASWTATLLRFPLTLRIAWILAVCCLYTAITGGRPPVMRAAVLVAVVMLSLWFRRPAQPFNTLSLAALILMLINPENLFHVGVQLSFLAVGTFFLCGLRSIASSRGAEVAIENESQLDQLIQSAQPGYYRIGSWALAKIGRAVWYSGCVTAMSLPLVWHYFHVVSFVSVVTNVVLSPFLFWSLAMGVATVVGGWILEPLAIIPGYLCGLGLDAMRSIIDVAAVVPLGHFWLPSPPTWWVIVFYIVMVGSLFIRQKRASWFRYGWIPVWGLVAWITATTASPISDGSFEATFVDVGHGTTVVLRDSEGHVWLYDCGRLANANGSSRDIDSTLWSIGATHLDAIFLSHADSDHYNALPGVLRRFSVEQIVTPPGMLTENEIGLIAIRNAIKTSGVPTVELFDGSDVTSETKGGLDGSCSILHPPRSGMDGSDNANSLVLRIDHGGTVLILPGDLEPPGTEMLINKMRPPPGGVLMAPHHGSLTMDAESILQWSRPSEVIVSGGKRAKKPEVRRMLNVVGSGVHVTAAVGAIRVTIHADGEIEIDSWADGGW
ncbi:ComEC family competence protein [Planctomycetes bacterium CA13]|uniref:ComEC family competence protein n=1 Tax=Novipirellula herctigrandis TaxID=2527986 RepID=A0A5C5Z5F3_9BACT|nr:ComEC family competence protein [Planctomycetes bacterium CA13]